MWFAPETFPKANRSLRVLRQPLWLLDTHVTRCKFQMIIRFSCRVILHSEYWPSSCHDATCIDIGFEVSSLNSMISFGLVINSTNETKCLGGPYRNQERSLSATHFCWMKFDSYLYYSVLIYAGWSRRFFSSLAVLHNEDRNFCHCASVTSSCVYAYLIYSSYCTCTCTTLFLWALL